jgi:hypothetical protein
MEVKTGFAVEDFHAFFVVFRCHAQKCKGSDFLGAQARI